MRRFVATICAVGLGVWLALGSNVALAQPPGTADFAAPFEAEPLPDELTVIDGLADPAPAPPPHAGPLPLVSNDLEPFEEEPELTPIKELSSGSWLRSGITYVEADVVVLQHNAGDRIKLATDATTGSKRVFSVPRGALGYAANMRINVGQNLFRDSMNRDHAVEFMFYGLGNWTGEGSITAASNNFLVSAIDPFVGGFNGSNEQTFRYASNLDSYEVNYRISWRLSRDQMVLQPGGDWVRQATPGTLFSGLAGIRVVELDQRFNYTSVSTQPNLRRGQLTSLTRNDLIGGQLGGLFMQQYSNWNWGVSGKAGVYVNFAGMTSDVTTVDPVLLELDRHDRDQAQVLSFLGELSVFGRYHLRPNASIRVAYEALWLNRVAEADQQIFLTAAPISNIETGGSPNYMGVSFGFEANW